MAGGGCRRPGWGGVGHAVGLGVEGAPICKLDQVRRLRPVARHERRSRTAAQRTACSGKKISRSDFFEVFEWRVESCGRRVGMEGEGSRQAQMNNKRSKPGWKRAVRRASESFVCFVNSESGERIQIKQYQHR